MKKLILPALTLILMVSCKESPNAENIKLMETYQAKMKSASSVKESDYWMHKFDSVNAIVNRVNDSISKTR